MTTTRRLSITDLRSGAIAADSTARRLYAVLVAAESVADEATALLTEYLEQREVAEFLSVLSPPRGTR